VGDRGRRDRDIAEADEGEGSKAVGSVLASRGLWSLERVVDALGVGEGEASETGRRWNADMIAGKEERQRGRDEALYIGA